MLRVRQRSLHIADKFERCSCKSIQYLFQVIFELHQVCATSCGGLATAIFQKRALRFFCMSAPGSPSAPVARERIIPPPGMSKRQYKRQLKAERIEKERPMWLAARKEKRKQAKQKRREAGEPPIKRHRPVPERHDPSNVGIIVDCGFDELMKEGERTSLARQIVHCYSFNSKAPLYVDLKITSFDKLLKKRFDENMHAQHEKWKGIEFQQQDFTPNDSMLYLSSDSENVLETLTPGTTYIIGGIVDKGRYKDLCKDKAEKMGLKTARLPIDKYIKLSGRRVLTTNHVFELMLRYLEFEDWSKAFNAVLPSRKLLETRAVADPQAAETPSAASCTESAASDNA